MKFAGSVDLDFLMYGYSFGYNWPHRLAGPKALSDREVFIFSKISGWSRKRLHIPSKDDSGDFHLFASMYPTYFQSNSRGVMIERSAYESLLSYSARIANMFDVCEGKLIVIDSSLKPVGI